MSAILKQFMEWGKTASAEKRADATAALVRVFLYSDLTRDEMDATEATITCTLRDPSILVRQAIARECANSQHAPKHIVLSLIDDVPCVAAIVLEHSELILDSELVDIIADGCVTTQTAIANRRYVEYSVSAAMCEIGEYDACLALIHNPNACITPNCFGRLAERFGDVSEFRDVMLTRTDLPMSVRHQVVKNLNKSLTQLVQFNAWMQPKRTDMLEKSTNDRITLKLAETAGTVELTELVIYLRDTGQLTTELLLSAACMGNLGFFEIALADLTGQSLTRVAGLVEGRNRHAFRALCKKAGLPEAAWPAFEIAVDTWHQTAHEDQTHEKRFARKMVERILTRYEKLFSDQQLDSLLVLLRRLATEIAREDADAFMRMHMNAA